MGSTLVLSESFEKFTGVYDIYLIQQIGEIQGGAGKILTNGNG